MKDKKVEEYLCRLQKTGRLEKFKNIIAAAKYEVLKEVWQEIEPPFNGHRNELMGNDDLIFGLARLIGVTTPEKLEAVISDVGADETGMDLCTFCTLANLQYVKPEQYVGQQFATIRESYPKVCIHAEACRRICDILKQGR